MIEYIIFLVSGLFMGTIIIKNRNYKIKLKQYKYKDSYA